MRELSDRQQTKDTKTATHMLVIMFATRANETLNVGVCLDDLCDAHIQRLLTIDFERRIVARILRLRSIGKFARLRLLVERAEQRICGHNVRFCHIFEINRKIYARHNARANRRIFVVERRAKIT